ncbi:MAG: beta-N-acetylhexosaminidase [Deltaproteobacteria bacterium]|nr:beta-N-acetylhexosaminidase [Deltaproteobacteria bacterium]
MSYPFAELLIAGFDGTTATRDVLGLARRGLGGVILFGRNIEAPAQVAELTHDLRLANPDIIVSVDQEGGRVARFRAPWTEFPDMATLGEINDVALTRRVAEVFAAELAAVGVNLDFAPVLDVHTNPANPIIGRRALSADAKQVSAHAVEFLSTLQLRHVAACGKHFPGHGDAALDSHKDLPVIAHDLPRLRETEFVPFIAAAKAGVASIMTAHIRVPHVDEAPATLSSTWMQLLREEIGFSGVIVSDDLEMKAIADRFAPDIAVRKAIEAGVDIVLECNSRDRVESALSTLSAMWGDITVRARMDDARKRIAKLRTSYPAPAARTRDEIRDNIGCPAHLAVRDEVLRRLEAAPKHH